MSLRKWFDTLKPLKRTRWGVFFISYTFQERGHCRSGVGSMVSTINISKPIGELMVYIAKDFPKEISKEREIEEDSVVITSFDLICEYVVWNINRDSPISWFLGFFYKTQDEGKER